MLMYTLWVTHPDYWSYPNWK